MAISELATSGTWGVGAAQSSVGPISLAATPADGDRTFVWAAWKDFSITLDTVTSNSGARAYTKIAEFADGSVVVGNGTGSVKVACWYKDALATDDGPTLTWSGSTDINTRCTNILRKASSETWDAPTFVTAAWPSSSSQTVSASSTLAVANGAMVMAAIGIRDDSATFTRGATTGIDVASGITWAADYVEEPVGHQSTTLGNDLAADRGHRLVTTGGTVTLRVTATLSAAETGSCLWVHQSVTAGAAERVPKYQPMIQLLAH